MAWRFLICVLLYVPSLSFALVNNDIPVIGHITLDQSLITDEAFYLFAENVTDNDYIARVWAVVRHPDNSLQHVVLKKTAIQSHRYELLMDGFSKPGTYEISIVAMDWTGNQSLPKALTLTVQLPKRAVIIAGGRQTNLLWSSIMSSISIAYRALMTRGFAVDNITIFSIESVPGIEKQALYPSENNIKKYFQNLNRQNTEEIVVYMVGDRDVSGFCLTQTDSLMATDLDQWLDNCQNNGIQRVMVISDFSASALFNAQLIPPEDKDRILIASSKENEISLAFKQSGFVFSDMFWKHVLHNGNIGHALENLQKILIWNIFRQTPCIDVNADGTYNAGIDHDLMFQQYIGNAANPESETPVIEKLVCQPDGKIQAEFTPSTTAFVASVQAIIFPPEFHQQIQLNSVQMIDSISLEKNNNQYYGNYSNVTLNGSYQIFLYATNYQGGVSELDECQFENSEALPDAYEMDNTPEDASLIRLFVSNYKDLITFPQWHNFHSEGDVDWLKFNAISGNWYFLEVKKVSQNADPAIEIYEADGRTLVAGPVDMHINGRNEYAKWRCEKTDMYYAKIYQCDAYTVESCHASYGEKTEYQVLYHRSILEFPGLIWGKIEPEDANATIRSFNNYTYQIVGYYYLKTIAGKVTIEITANGFEPLIDEYNVLSCLGSDLEDCIEPNNPEDKYRVDIVLKPIINKPVPEFSANTKTGLAPLEVSFVNTSRDFDQCHWSFGDGKESNKDNPIHIYKESGIYSVELTAMNASGKESLKYKKYIHVIDPPPISNFSASKISGTPPLEVQWKDLSTGEIDSWSWDFGDGAESDKENPVHTYQEPNKVYSVALTVKGPGGKHTKIEHNYIHVNAFPPIANFRMEPEVGIAPLNVQFYDQSQGTISKATWFIDTIQYSQTTNPEYTFITPGTYNILLKVDGPGGQDEKIAHVTVKWPPPIANFIATPNSGVEPLEVQFKDQSLGNISQWLWHFGDNQTSHDQHPKHVFKQSASFTVQLTVTGLGGQKTKERINYINVNQAPPPLIADFSASPQTENTPLNVIFSDESKGRILTWHWDFGDGTTGDQPVANHTYRQAGMYFVSLTVTNNQQTDTVQKYIEVKSSRPSARFTLTAPSGCFPLTVSFINTSEGNIDRYLWNFGDGQSDTSENPVHVYKTPGKYTVLLTVDGPGGFDKFEQADAVTVDWPPPVSNFLVIPDKGVAPLTVQMIDQSVGRITSWQWLFDNGGTAFRQECSSTYALPGQYDISLVVSGPGGSHSKTIYQAVTVEYPAPEPDFSANPTKGNAPQSIQFTDHSSGTITHWLWNFGDGHTSNDQHPLHLYEKQGQYTVSLTTTGPGGSNIMQRKTFIDIQWPMPVVSFSAAPTSGIVPLTVKFTDQSSDQIQNWLWMFGDEKPDNEPTYDITRRQQHPVHIYTQPGQYSVSLTVSNPGSQRTEKKDFLISVLSPSDPEVLTPLELSADFYASTIQGGAPLKIQFFNTTSDQTASMQWDFGDNVTSQKISPVHTYTQAGIFTVKLTATTDQSTDEKERRHYIDVTPPEPVANFSMTPKTGATPLTVCFNDLSVNTIDQWLWDFGDGHSSDQQHPIHKYQNAGNYRVSLTVKGPGGSDTHENSSVTVYLPLKAKYSWSYNNLSTRVVFINQSSGQIVSYHWDFGDGTTSQQEHPQKIYDRPGTYWITLTVKAPNGTDTYTSAKPLVISSQSLFQYYQHVQQIPADKSSEPFYFPFGITQNPSQTLIVADYGNNRIVAYTPNTKIEKVQSIDDQPYEIKGPSGICQNNEGHTYVTDTVNHCIKVFDHNGVLIHQWGTYGSDVGQFDFPLSLAVDQDRHVYVADTNNHRIQKYTHSGTFLTHWGQQGNGIDEMAFPSGIAVDVKTVYVTDSGNQRILIFTSTGHYQNQWPAPSRFPYHLTTDPYGCVYVSDVWDRCIFKYSMEGHVLSKIYMDNVKHADILFPTHLHVNSQGHLFVSDTQQHVIHVFQPMEINPALNEQLKDIIALLQILADDPVSLTGVDYDWNDNGCVELEDVLFLMSELCFVRLNMK